MELLDRWDRIVHNASIGLCSADGSRKQTPNFLENGLPIHNDRLWDFFIGKAARPPGERVPGLYSPNGLVSSFGNFEGMNVNDFSFR